MTHSWPDICYDISRYIYKTHDLHWKASKRILQYIQGTRSYDIHYAADSELELVGYTDSDWVGDSIDRKYTYGYVFMFSGGPISWSSKKNTSIALSSAKAEYRGVVNACIQAVWLQGIILEFDIGSNLSTVLFFDNQSAVKISIDVVTRHVKTPNFHKNLKF